MKQEAIEAYDGGYYDRYDQARRTSAAVVLRLLFEHYRPRSVIDVGCGQGAWLAAAERLGVGTLRGVDGPWVDAAALTNPAIDFTAVDLAVAWPALDRRYDLCLSLEVAEHLPAARARPFVDFLCGASDTVVFSAAGPFQGGENHVNEQWPTYWIDHFEANGYTAVDFFRPRIWRDPAVTWWYRQNTFLFVGPDNVELNAATLQRQERSLVDVVHPLNLAGKWRLVGQIEDPSLRFCLGVMRRYLRRRLKR